MSKLEFPIYVLRNLMLARSDSICIIQGHNHDKKLLLRLWLRMEEAKRETLLELDLHLVHIFNT